MRREKRRLENSKKNAFRSQSTTAVYKAISADSTRTKRRRAEENRAGKQLVPSQFTEFMGNLSTNLSAPIPRCFTTPQEMIMDIQHAIESQDIGKAAGPDGIHVEMLQVAPRLSAQLLFTMWSTFGRLAYVPNKWHEGLLIPIFKAGHQQDPSCYRPICLISHLRKIIEKAITVQIHKHFKPSGTQHGFRKDTGIDDALLLAQHATSTLSKHVAVLDLQKAYDRVNRNRLLYLCQKIFPENLLAMIQCLLQTNTVQTIGDPTKNTAQITRGVPQGSVLSPDLFNIYIDPLALALMQISHEEQNNSDKDENHALFADDTILYANSMALLQQQLDCCQQWAEQNDMQWHTSKSCAILQSTPQHIQPSLYSTPLPCKTNAKYLGVTLTKEGLSSRMHVERTKNARKKDLPATQCKHSKPRLAPQTSSLRLRDVYSISIPLRNPACTLEQSAPRQRHGAPDTTIPKYPTRPPHPDQTAN